MAYRMTREELDQQFEQFLKESVSDDSAELSNSPKRPSVLDSLGKAPQKPVKKSPRSLPWWQEDDDSDDVLGKGEAGKCRFIKCKNTQAVDIQEKSGQRQSPPPVPSKPIPKPRSKALNRAEQLDKIPPNQENSCSTDRQTGSEHTPAKPNQSSTEYSYSEESEAEGVTSSRSSGRSPVSPENSHSTQWKTSSILTNFDESSTENSDSDSRNSGNGIMGSGRTFRKSLRKSQAIEEVEETQLKESRGDPIIFSRDSLEPDDSLMVSRSAQSAGDLGLDSLNDTGEGEKACFLASLNRGNEPITEDPRLREEMESSPSRGVGFASTKEDQKDDAERNSDSDKDNLASPAYSEDFEDEASEKEPEEKKPERRGMLAKVSLHDSMNSTDGALVPVEDSFDASGKTDWPESRMTEAAGPGATGQSYGQSGASEMEALQEAYRQISHSEVEFQEREQEDHRSPSSPTSPDVIIGSLKHAATTESDLPTAEELMRAIGPDSALTYGLSLHPFKEAAVDYSPESVASKISPVRAAAEHSAELLRRADEESSPVSTNHKHRSIAEEVKRLMQEQEDSSLEQPNISNKGRQLQVRGRTATLAASRKAPVPSGRTKRTEIRPIPKAAVPTRTSQVAKHPSALTQRKSQSQTTKRVSALSQTHIVNKGPNSDLKVSSQLLTSVQSFAAFLQQHAKVDGVDGMNAGHPARSDNTRQKTDIRDESEKEVTPDEYLDLPSERSSLERLRLQLAQRERELLLREEHLQKEHSREISALRQENYILQSKLHSVEEARKKQRFNFGDATDPVTEEKMKLIEKEMKEQETLIQGYHVENEKLYLQMKALQAQNKQNEEAMFTENQRLLSELSLTKEQLKKNNKQKTMDNAGTPDQGYTVTELMTQVQAAERREDQLQEEIRRLKQEKQALQVDLQVTKKERDLVKAQVVDTSGHKSFELKLLEERHKEEVAGLKKRLQWYAENQELLDKDAARLRAANEEIQRLTEQVEKLKMETAKRANQQEKKSKERAAEAKKIQDLERQVREMEEILRRRHPNSLPALIYAAAAAGGEEGDDSGFCAANRPSQTAALLERRVHRLEAELESRDDEAKRSLRAMEQQFQRIRLQYEQQISELEQRLAEQNQKHPKDSVHESEPQSQELQEKLEQMKAVYQSQVKALKDELASLQEQLHQTRSSAESGKPSRSPSRHQRQTEAAQAARIERMTQELATKSRTIQELNRTVERLQRERRTVSMVPRADGTSAQPRRHPAPAKDPCPAPTEIFPSAQDEKEYQPRAFSGSHISEVQQENDWLRMRLEQLEKQWEQERITLQAAASQARSELQRVQERNVEHLSSLKADHQREIEHLLARHALEHSSSKVAELTNQVKAQEVMVLHLREQVKELQKTKEALAVSKLREETLQNQLVKLLEELKQAKEAHTPELRHFASLEHKIHTMELRYNQREQELQQMIAQTRSVVEQEQQMEVARWKKLVQEKCSELETFRRELDSILDVLRELQKQGVVIPATQHSSAAGFVFRPLRS